jgi:predicted TIM-barrel fold metal-dependent hydrolase
MSDAQAATAPSKPRRRIDIHQHIYPARFTKRMIDALVEDAPDYPASMYLEWTPDACLAMMEKFEIDTVMVSLTSPGLWFGDAVAAREGAREFNELAASMIRDNPGRFGAFAPIPLPDEAGAFTEIEHAFDRLKLNGIGLHSSYAGKLLGSKEFAAVFDELNRRKATVFVHPVANKQAYFTSPWLALPTLEFVFDTTRTITSLIASGTLARCPNIKFIFPHAGGAIFTLARRIESSLMRRLTQEQRDTYMPRGFGGALQTLNFDVVSASNPTAMAAVRTIAPVSRLLFGTDFPFVPANATIEQIRQIGLTSEELQAVECGNALKLCNLPG